LSIYQASLVQSAMEVIFWLIWLFLFPFTWDAGSQSRRRTERLYRQLAEAFQGSIETRGRDQSPLIRFTHRGSLIRAGLSPVNSRNSGDSPRTRVVARFRQSLPFRLEITPRSGPGFTLPPRDARALELNRPDFDSQFRLHANDAAMAAGFLDDQVRLVLGKMDHLALPDGMLVSVSPERLLTQVDRDLSLDFDQFEQLIRMTLLLHDRLVQAVERHAREGVSIVEELAGEEPEEAAVCQVCGEPIGDGPITRCLTCHAPHHGDCWDYVGACSIYGCQGKTGRQEFARSTDVL